VGNGINNNGLIFFKDDPPRGGSILDAH